MDATYGTIFGRPGTGGAAWLAAGGPRGLRGAVVDDERAQQPAPARGAAPPEEGDERARAGREPFQPRWDAHGGEVTTLCRRLLGSVEEAEDARHEVFLKASGGFASYDARRPFRTWLLAVAAHHCLDRLRRRGREARIFAPLEEETAPATAGSPLRALLDAEARARLLGALDTLPARYRAPLALRYFADLSYDEIAELLQVSRSQVGVLLHRGRLRLRRAVEAGGAGGAGEDAP